MLKTSLIFTTLFSQITLAYPLFFSCGADKSISNILTPQELSDQLNALSKASLGKPEATKQACSDFESCVTDFLRLAQLAKPLANISREAILSEIQKKSAQTEKDLQQLGTIKITDDDMNSLGKLNRMNAQTYSCQSAKSEYGADSVRNDNQCVLGNFHHSPYMYVTGQRFSGEEDGEVSESGPVRCDAIDDAIEAAVATGQDPYAALAISLMENGTSIDSLYLDPIGSVTTLGCPAVQIPADKVKNNPDLMLLSALGNDGSDEVKPKNQKPNGYNLVSFGTFYNVKYGVVNNSSLLQQIKDYHKAANIDIETVDKTYFCSNSTDVVILDKPNKDMCCLQSNFKPKVPKATHSEKIPLASYLGGLGGGSVKKALTYASLGKYLQTPLEKNFQGSDPSEEAARRLQRFNGYSRLMGGAEGVSAWRSGVNYYNTPAYGYQAMDFILNTLVANPYIKSKVEEIQAKLGKKSPSVLCEKSGKGSFYIDSNYYFQKHAKSPRMDSILASWNAGVKDFSKLKKSQKNVLKGEFEAICEERPRKILASKLNDKNNLASLCKYWDEKDAEEEISETGEDIVTDINEAKQMQASYQYYMTKILPLRKTIAQASFMDQGYSWNEMTDKQFDSLLEKTKSYNSNATTETNQPHTYQ